MSPSSGPAGRLLRLCWPTAELVVLPILILCISAAACLLVLTCCAQVQLLAWLLATLQLVLKSKHSEGLRGQACRILRLPESELMDCVQHSAMQTSELANAAWLFLLAMSTMSSKWLHCTILDSACHKLRPASQPTSASQTAHDAQSSDSPMRFLSDTLIDDTLDLLESRSAALQSTNTQELAEHLLLDIEDPVVSAMRATTARPEAIADSKTIQTVSPAQSKSPSSSPSKVTLKMLSEHEHFVRSIRTHKPYENTFASGAR